MKPLENRDFARQLANVVLLPLGIALNLLPGIGGRSVGAVARQTEPLLAAAGWAFSIWGLIFIGQLAYAVFQVLPSQRESPVLRRIGWYTAAIGALEGLWSIAFSQLAFTSAWLIMLVLLGCLVAVELQVRSGSRGAERLLIRLPFAINLGWITVATLLNTSQFLWVELGWQGAPFTPAAWASALVTVAAGIAVTMMLVRRNFAFGAVVAWALLAVADYRRIDSPSVSRVCVGAVLVLLAVAPVALLGLMPRRRTTTTPTLRVGA